MLRVDVFVTHSPLHLSSNGEILICENTNLSAVWARDDIIGGTNAWARVADAVNNPQRGLVSFGRCDRRWSQVFKFRGPFMFWCPQFRGQAEVPPAIILA